MDRVLTQDKTTGDLAHMGRQGTKNPALRRVNVLLGDGSVQPHHPAFTLRVLYCFQLLRLGIRLPDISMKRAMGLAEVWFLITMQCGT